MPSFKPKATKKIKVSKKYTTTLDSKHRDFIEEFDKDEIDVMPKLKEEKAVLKEKLQNDPNIQIDEIMEIRDRIKEINETIKTIKLKKNDYLLNNSKYIFEYFENKKNIDIENNVTASKNQMLFTFFKVQKEPGNIVNENKNKNIVQKYLSNIDESFIDVNSFVRQTDVCEHCYKGELIPLEDEGVLICNVCAVNIPFLIENEKPSYKEPPKEVCFYAYKKINHFKEIISQFQGKETTQIHDDVIEQIQMQIKKERINLEQLSHHKTKEILKKLGFNKYYEHIAFIKNKLGIKPPVFSQELEDTLYNLFMEIQAPYAKTCPDYRVNFLNYYYVLFKFCE